MIVSCRICLALTTVFTLQASLLSAGTNNFSGYVVGVSDGDTITVLVSKKPIKIRLSGIDCPEKGQAFGDKAKRLTSTLAFNKEVNVIEHGLDKYGRVLGEVILPDNRNLNHELLKAGLAWWYKKYSKDRQMEALQLEARNAKRGLWSDPNPIAPWEWRKMRKSKF